MDLTIGKPLEGKVALVTGGTRNIGRQIALTFAQAGAHVVTVYHRNEKAAEETTNAILAFGVKSESIMVNLGGGVDVVNALMDRVHNDYGGPNILVHSAAKGLGRPTEVENFTTTTLKEAMDLNTWAFHEMIRRIVKQGYMQSGDSILSLTSLGGRRVLPFYTGVGISKAAMEMLMRSWAVKLAEMGIPFNVLSPGAVIGSDGYEALRQSDEKNGSHLLDAELERIPTHRFATKEEIAHVALFFAVFANPIITGQIIDMDGGGSLLGY